MDWQKVLSRLSVPGITLLLAEVDRYRGLCFSLGALILLDVFPGL